MTTDRILGKTAEGNTGWEFLLGQFSQTSLCRPPSREEDKNFISTFFYIETYFFIGPFSPANLGGRAVSDPKERSEFPAAAAAAKSCQSCPTLCDPIDGSPSGSPVPGILQTRTLEWVAISFSSAWKWKVKVKLLSRVWLLVTPWTAAYQAPLSMGFPAICS